MTKILVNKNTINQLYFGLNSIATVENRLEEIIHGSVGFEVNNKYTEVTQQSKELFYDIKALLLADAAKIKNAEDEFAWADLTTANNLKRK
jgi:hypothetical protein